MTSFLPKVSVIVTTYNRADLLRETVDSILGQTFRDLELIVVDNYSRDGTADYLNSIPDGRLRHTRNANNGVIAVNRNLGITLARGEYVAFCDDDDEWKPDKLRLQVELMDSQPELALSYTNAETFRSGEVLSHRMIRRRVVRNHFSALLRGNFIPNSSVLVRRSVFEEIGLLSIDGTLREDYEMWLRVSSQFPLAGIDQPLIRYRVHSTNIASNRATETLRAIRTLRSVSELLNLPAWIFLPNAAFQFLKYMAYRLSQIR
jgi:glycosyltransferase involved in cell wall biosynthesis